MPEYLLVKNGHGRLLDDAEANSGTYLSKDSTASKFAKLRDCSLHTSNATARCQIYGGEYWLSTIGGNTICAGHPVVHNSILICSEVSGQPRLDRVHAVGNTEICDAPQLIGTADEYLWLENAIIYGNPVIQGSFTVTGRVHEGTWTRAPRHIKLPWCDLSECVVKNGELHILCDCRCRSASYWKRHGAKLAQRWGWSEEMISITLDKIEQFL